MAVGMSVSTTLTGSEVAMNRVTMRRVYRSWSGAASLRDLGGVFDR
jgi:hypothetical protein